ncbi:HECT-domain-containing protein [Pseudocohnilembus persalinus]|uniref:HECT-type E3 ubiquitin transferase n=1 Tax=Pseudocohnilembus persalinus TaxID=266149 RepID=A0A0V0QU07_PSEPJ|nr:HECT-domain-containing protein [Pseudocohnilembus persalinus]|eukprot:KRX05875.1 HECT-domain-containing protein [Pseudocohnilembus persalinus]
MIIQGQLFNQDDDRIINYQKEARYFLGLKDFPFNDFYMEMQDLIKQFRGPKFMQGFLLNDEELDLSLEAKFIEDAKNKLEPHEIEGDENGTQITASRNQIQVVLGTLGWIFNYLRELSKPEYQKIKNVGSNQEILELLNKIASIVKNVLDFLHKTNLNLSGGIILGINEFLVQNNSSNITKFYGEQEQNYSQTLMETFKLFITSILNDGEQKPFYNLIDAEQFGIITKDLRINFSEKQLSSALNDAKKTAKEDLSYAFTLQRLLTQFSVQQLLAAEDINKIEQEFLSLYLAFIDLSLQNGTFLSLNEKNSLQLQQSILQGIKVIKESGSQQELCESLGMNIALNYNLNNPQIQNLNINEDNREFLNRQFQNIADKYLQNFLSTLEKLTEITKQSNELENKMYEIQSINNQYNKSILQALYNLNAYRSTIYVKQIVQNLIMLIELGQGDLSQKQFETILTAVTDLVHPAIERTLQIRQNLKQNYNSKGFFVSYDNGQGGEIIGLLEFLYSYIEQNMGIISVEDKKALKTFRTIEILYTLLKHYLSERSLEFNEGKVPIWFKDATIAPTLDKLAQILPKINPQLLKLKGELFYEDSIKYIQENFELPNFEGLGVAERWSLKQAVLQQRDRDAFPLDSLKYIIRLPHVLTQFLQHAKTRQLANNLQQQNSQKFLEQMNPEISVQGTIKDITQQVILFTSQEQQVRKSLLHRAQESSFDIADYLQKLSKFSRILHGAFQINNIFNKKKTEDDKEKQFLVQIFKFFFTNWFEPFTNGSNSFPFLELILTSSTEEEWPKVVNNLCEFFHESFLLQSLFTPEQVEGHGPFSVKMLEIIEVVITYLKKNVSQIKSINDKLQSKIGEVEKVQFALQKANQCKIGLERIGQLIGKIHEKVWAEIINNGLVLQNRNLEFLVKSLKFVAQIEKNGETKKTFAVLSKHFAQNLFNLLEKLENATYDIEDIPVVNSSFILASKVQSDFKIPECFQNIVNLIDKEIQQYPPLNTPALIHAIFEFSSNLVSFASGGDYIRPGKTSYFKRYQDIICLIDLYISHYNSAPVSVASFLNNSQLLFRPLYYQLRNLENLIMVQTDQENNDENVGFKIDYGHVLYIMTEKLVNLSKFLENSDFNIALVEVMRETVNIIIACMHRINIYEIQLPQHHTEYLRRTLLNDILNLTYKSNRRPELQAKYFQLSRELHAQMFRVVECFFTLQKPNFLKSNLEIRIKQKLFDSQKREFFEFFSVQQLEQLLEPDMFENGQVLSNVLTNLIEGFNEKDLDAIRENVKQLKKERKQALKKEGEEEEEEAQEQQEEQQQQEEEEAQFADDDESEEAQEWRRKKAEEAALKKKKEEEEAQRKMMEEEGKVYKNYLRLKSIDFVSLSSSNVTKLTHNQQKVLQHILKLLQKRILAIFNDANRVNVLERKIAEEKARLEEIERQKKLQEEEELANLGEEEKKKQTIAKAKAAKAAQAAPQKQVDQSELLRRKIDELIEQKNKAHKEKEEKLNEEITGEYMDFYFLSQLLITLMNKYPLVVPNILETQVQAVEINFLKRHKEMPFLDFLITMQPFTNYRLTEIIHLLCTQHNAFIEDKKSYNFTSSAQYYAEYIFERNMVWLKRCITLKDFYKHETGLNLVRGFLTTLRYFFREHKQILDKQRIEKILSFIITMLNLAQDQNDQIIVDDLNLLELFNEVYEFYICFKLNNFTGGVLQNLDEKTEQILRFNLNNNFFDFFTAKEAEAEGAAEHNELIQNRFKLNYQEIMEQQSTATLTNFANILKYQNADSFGLPDKKKSIISAEFGLTTGNFMTTNNKLDKCDSILPEFEQQVEALFWRKQVLNSALLMKYTQNRSGFEENCQNLLQEFEKFLVNTNGLIQLKQELKWQFYNWFNEKFGYNAQFNENNNCFTLVESILFKVQRDVQDSINLTSLLQNIFFPQDEKKIDSAQELFDQNKEKQEPEEQQVFVSPLSQIRSQIEKEQEAFLNPEKTVLHDEQPLPAYTKKEIGDFDEQYSYSEDQIFIQQKGFPYNAVQLYEINEGEFKSADYSQKLQLLEDGRKKYQEKLSAQKLILKEQRKQQILQEFISEATGQVPSPEIDQNLKNFVKNNLTQIFDQLSEKDKRSVLTSWDENFLQILPEDLQKQAKIFKDQLNSNNNDYNQNINNNNKNVFKQIQTAHVQINSQNEQEFKALQKLKSCEFYVNEIPVFDEEFLLKIIEKTHYINVENFEEFEKSMQTVLKTLSLLTLSPYNAFKIVDCFQFLMVVHNFKSSLNSLPNEPKISKLFNLPLFDKSINRPYQNLRDVKLIKTAIIFYVYQSFIAQNVNLMQTCLFQYPMWNKSEYKFIKDDQEVIYAPNFQAFEIFQELKLSNNFKGIVDHKKEGDNINLIAIFQLYNKSIQQERIPANLPVENSLKNFKQFAYKSMNLMYGHFFNRVQYVATNKIYNNQAYPNMQNVQKELNTDFIIDFFIYDVIENKTRLKNSFVYFYVQQLAVNFQSFSEFTKKLFDNLGKKLNQGIKLPRNSFLAFKSYITKFKNSSDLNNNDDKQLFDQYQQILFQFESYFEGDIGNFRRFFKDLTEIFQTITLRLEEDSIVQNVIEQKREAMKLEIQKQKEEEKKQIEQERQERLEREELERQQRRAEGLEDENENEEDENKQEGEEGEEGQEKADQNEEKQEKNQEENDQENQGNEGEEEGEENEEKQQPEPEIQVVLDEQDRIAIMEQLQQRKFGYLQQLQKLWVNKELLEFFASLVDFIYNYATFAWHNDQGPAQSLRLFNLPIKILKQRNEKLVNLSFQEQQTLGLGEIDNYLLLEMGLNKISKLEQLKDISIPEGITFFDLYEIFQNKFLSLVAQFVNSGKIKNKNTWITYLCSETNDKTYLKQMKLADLQQKSLERYRNKQVQIKEKPLEIICQKEDIFGSSLGDLLRYNAAEFTLNTLKIKMDSEKQQEKDDVEQFALTQEWVNNIIKQVTNPEFGLFKLTENQVGLNINEQAFLVPDYDLYFKLIGRIVGKSLLEGYETQLELCKPLLKQILGVNVNLSDLEEIDSKLFQQLNEYYQKSQQNFQEEEENLQESLQNKYFSYQQKVLNIQQTIELIPNGIYQEVTIDNIVEYVKLYALQKLVKNIEIPLKYFKEGLFEIISQQSLQKYTPKELGQKLAGQQEIDVDQLSVNAKYNEYGPESDQILWLWEVLKEFSSEQKGSFMFFVTSNFRQPSLEVQDSGIEICKSENLEDLPTACVSTRTIILPEYESKEILEEKLIIALSQGNQGLQLQ